MNKIKIRKNIITVKSEKGQQLAESKVNFANKELSNCLLKIGFKKKRSSFKVIVYGEKYMTLKEYLSAPLDKKSFATLLKNISVNLETMRDKFYNPQNVLLDINYVMFDSVYRKIYFAYIPIEPFDSGFRLNEFLLSIADQATFESSEDTAYVDEYKRILSENTGFSFFDLNEYIERLNLDDSTKKKQHMYCPHCNSPINNGSVYCSKCGFNLLSVTTNNSKGTYNFWQTSISKEREEDIKAVKSGLVLRRKISGETIKISKPIFKIGRNKNLCDYVISDPSISGEHAIIISKSDGDFCIADNNSTNYTFLNNRRVLPNKAEELTNGCEIRFAKIAFEVFME